MKRSVRNSLIGVVVALVAVSIALQNNIDPHRDRIQPPLGGKSQTKLIFQLPAPYIIASFTGMRESVAGLLWVRADEFFHSGNYEAIFPLVRIITWLDPHYMDVYKVGAWHLDFNITDSSERSDRRLIPPALALMREGIENNRETFDLPFDLAFTHYHLKMKDYENARKWMEVAQTRPDLSSEAVEARERYPLVVKRMLGHMYEKCGDIESAKRQWRRTIADSEKLARDNPRDYTFRTALDIARQNYEIMLWREKHRKYDLYPPIDMKFDAKWVRKRPGVIVVSGTINLISREDYLKLDPSAPAAEKRESMKVRLEAIQDNQWVDGARIDIILQDLDYKPQSLKEFSWEVPRDVTIMVESVRIGEGQFETEIDMSRDPHMYSFKKDKYRLVLTLDPRSAPDFIQDRIGWRGEGLTDKNYLDTKTIPGVRMIRKEWIIDRKDII